MEVHHHAAAPKQEKHFKHYLFEFLMLFLAVTLGFFVENMREHTVENKREKQFIRSFAEDLKNDIAQLKDLKQKREEKAVWFDSLTLLLNTPDPDKYSNQIYFFSRYLPRPYVFYNNDATLQQLKYAGNLRLIRNKAAADSILAYDRQFRFIDAIRSREEELVQRIFNSLNKIFDPAVFDQMITYDIEFTRPAGNPKLLTKDRAVFQNFLSDIHYLKTVNLAQIGWFKRQAERARTTLAFLQKEYHLK
jgi:hypothetical protein